MDSGRVKLAAIFHNVRVVERSVYGLANKTKKMTHSLEYLLDLNRLKKNICFHRLYRLIGLMCPKKKHINPDSTFQSTHHSMYFTLFMTVLLDRKLIYHRLHILYIDYVLLHL